ncbi:Thyrotroph embryonic factor-like [Tropilaelaps mercedesae]|uniref:Thyrotroph embryonic factor-like n=1 Tax=Tropilaelaps mercedesae TaxID=418985 RepID=A0A1V9XGE4_9ACAR|nr:Thyrotroph embryonic factor-like [Tropilaelaps mercedesae]
MSWQAFSELLRNPAVGTNPFLSGLHPVALALPNAIPEQVSSDDYINYQKILLQHLGQRHGQQLQLIPSPLANLTPRRKNSDSDASSDSNNTVDAIPAPGNSTNDSETRDSTTPTSQAACPQPRKRGKALPDELKDATYWERRRRNNIAAKRSRDARRAKEEETALRAAVLERENLQLRLEASALKQEIAHMKSILRLPL